METVVIQAKSKSDIQFLLELAQKMGFNSWAFPNKENNVGQAYSISDPPPADLIREDVNAPFYKSDFSNVAEKRKKAVQPEIQPPLSNIQFELLKLYSAGVPDEYLDDIKRMLAKYLFEKASDRADKIWDEKGYSEKILDKKTEEPLQFIPHDGKLLPVSPATEKPDIKALAGIWKNKNINLETLRQEVWGDRL